MLIRVFGFRGTFDHNQIGGTDSYFRRIGLELIKRGHDVEFVHYGFEQDHARISPDGITIREFKRFSSALHHLETANDPVLVAGIKGSNRLHFILHRHLRRKHSRFHMVYTLFSDNRWGRTKHFLESTLYPYKSGCICMSSRLVDYVRRFRNKAEVVLPPVPLEYYLSPASKPIRKKIVVGYIGRLESPKGAPEAISVLEKLSGDPRFQTRVLGYGFDGSSEFGKLRQRIQCETGIVAHYGQHQGWSPQVDQEIRNALAEFDFLLLPYRTVASSIDTPLLLLEGMASLCCCLVPPEGDIPEIVGSSPFLVPFEGFSDAAFQLLSACNQDDIVSERHRLARQIKNVACDTASVTGKLIRLLSEESAWA